MVLLVLVLAQAAYLVYLNGQVTDADHRIATAASQDARAADDLKKRIGALEQQAARSMDVTAVPLLNPSPLQLRRGHLNPSL